MQRVMRLGKELKMAHESPQPGISFWPVNDDLEHLQAKILGADSSPYEGGIFKLEIGIPERYPFEPPTIKFVTPIYHPNIDNAGRICLDVLKPPPKGSWKPCLNLAHCLMSLRLLMAEPNLDDPLVVEISEECRSRRDVFVAKAKEMTLRFAKVECPDGDKKRKANSTEVVGPTVKKADWGGNK